MLKAVCATGGLLLLLYLTTLSTTMAPKPAVKRPVGSLRLSHEWPPPPPAPPRPPPSGGCMVHTDSIDPTVPYKTQAAVDGADGYLLLAIVNESVEVAATESGPKDKRVAGPLPCQEPAHIRLFSALTGDSHSDATARATVTGCRIPNGGHAGQGQIGSPASPRQQLYKAAVCLPLLFGSSFQVVQAFAAHHLTVGFDRVFAYSRSADETYAVVSKLVLHVQCGTFIASCAASAVYMQQPLPLSLVHHCCFLSLFTSSPANATVLRCVLVCSFRC
jgi:hypothetical protein